MSEEFGFRNRANHEQSEIESLRKQLRLEQLHVQDANDEIVLLKNQRDELLAALECAIGDLKLHAALASVKGDKP